MLTLEDVTVRFGGLTALNRVSLALGDTGITGLIGPNGAGKTTLFNAISGLVKPASGRLSFDGRPLPTGRQHARARLGIGRTFQIPQPMHELTVRENLAVAQRFGAGRRDDARLDEILAFTRLADKAHRQAATELSLTELKALEVAKALATEPRLLLLDEVLAGLESNGKQQFTAMLHDLHARFRISMLVIEHDIQAIRTLCARVAVLDFGALIADGTPDAVFADPRVIASYTGAAHD